MGKLKKQKGQSGEATAFISRSRAIKRLQVSLSDFRRLCILKGIYPRDPKNRKRVSQAAPGSGGVDQTYYAVKDVHFLAQEPLLERFRLEKSWHKKLKKWRAKGEKQKVANAQHELLADVSALDHLIRERYPTFADALRDLDDAVSMVALFARLPKPSSLATGGLSKVRVDFAEECARLMHEWRQALVGMSTKSASVLRSFISIRGIYYQAQVVPSAAPVTWLEPLEGRTLGEASDVDFKVMLTFLELYMTLLRFVNYRLYARLGWPYRSGDADEEGDLPVGDGCEHALAAQTSPTGRLTPFTGCTFFIGRECPQDSLSFLNRCADGAVSSDEADPSITHQVVDRPALAGALYADRRYVQPQWVWDSVNAGKRVPEERYGVGATLPPHMSPFAADPAAVVAEGAREEPPAGGSLDEKPAKTERKKLTREQRQLAASMLSKKQKKVYERVSKAQLRMAEEAARLAERRKRIA